MKTLFFSAILVLAACGEPPSTTDDLVDTADDTGADIDTWTSFGEEFMATYCVECHSTSPKDFRSYADVVANQDFIRCGVASTTLADCGTWPPAQQFPVGNGPKPSDPERDQLTAWIDDGLPE